MGGTPVLLIFGLAPEQRAQQANHPRVWDYDKWRGWRRTVVEKEKKLWKSGWSFECLDCQCHARFPALPLEEVVSVAYKPANKQQLFVNRQRRGLFNSRCMVSCLQFWWINLQPTSASLSVRYVQCRVNLQSSSWINKMQKSTQQVVDTVKRISWCKRDGLIFTC